MMRLETTVAVSDRHAYDPDAGLEFLVTSWSDGSESVATRLAGSGESWGPAVSLRPVGVAA